MAGVTRTTLRRESAAANRVASPAARWGSLAIFALISLAAPLAFGAVDRITQIAMLLLLAVGIILRPPEISRLGKALNIAVITLAALVVVKEFAPAAWFGSTAWRNALAGSYGLDLPWTHNPEPSRAFDAMLASAAAAVWFAWARTISAHREDRPIAAWILFGAAAVVAIVSFATRGIDPEAIYGLRFTPGWRGFGPFPNRNHTACYFAMSALIGAGCITWAAMRRKFGLLALGAAMFALLVAAMLTTGSRGGLIGFACGAAIFVGMVLAKRRSRRAFGIAVAAALIVSALALIFGAQTLSRFRGAGDAQTSTETRRAVWRDAIGMWKDAPLLGHGLGTFPQLFPIYQQLALDDQIVLHPESSWLLWLVELGLIPTAIGAGMVGTMLFRSGREAFDSHNSFYLRAGAIAAVLTLLSHAAIDVPAHRWGTAGLALSLLALAAPRRASGSPAEPSRKPALIAAGLAFFWAMPLLADWPAWSPLSVTRLLSRAETTGAVRLRDLEQALHYFPLNPTLHQMIGLREVRSDGRGSAEWARHFQIVARLIPGSWRPVAEQARAARVASPGYAIHAWQLAVERGGHRRDELLELALKETASIPGSVATWSNYADAHPELLLAFARHADEAPGRDAFDRWWQVRGLGSDRIEDAEVDAFYMLASRWGNGTQLAAWIAKHPERKARDFRMWAALEHVWGNDARAWELLSSAIPEPSFPGAPPTAREPLELKWRTDRADIVNARALAHFLAHSGDAAASQQIIMEVAQRPGAPQWFVQKAAHLLAKEQRTSEAVALLLRDPDSAR